MKFRAMRRCVFIISVIALMTVSCSDRPKDILSEDKMLDVMTDLQIAEAYDRSGDSPQELQGYNKEKLGLGVLRQHGVSEEEMDSTLAWYGKNMDEYAKLYKKIDERLAKRQQQYAKAAGESENLDGGLDLWPYGKHLVIDEHSFTDGIVINIPAEDIVPGEKLIWKMRVQGATTRNMTLGVDYSDGSASIVRNTAYSSGPWIETVLHTDTVITPSGIFGVVNFGVDHPRVFVDSIQLLHQPRSKSEADRIGLQRHVAPAQRTTILPSDSSANSSRVEDSIKHRPSLSTSKSLGVRTRL